MNIFNHMQSTSSGGNASQKHHLQLLQCECVRACVSDNDMLHIVPMTNCACLSLNKREVGILQCIGTRLAHSTCSGTCLAPPTAVHLIAGNRAAARDSLARERRSSDWVSAFLYRSKMAPGFSSSRGLLSCGIPAEAVTRATCIKPPQLV